MTNLTKEISAHNYKAFLWHGLFLAFASSFMDVDTIMPSMITNVGGSVFHVSLLVTIMLGGSTFTQLLFAPYIHNRKAKKITLLIGIYLRIFSLTGLSILFFNMTMFNNTYTVWIILLLVSVFAFSGAFANISYVDLIGKSIIDKDRKSLLSLRQVLSAIGVLLSAYFAHKILSLYGIPKNYSLLFLFATLFLFIASWGFWVLKETDSGKNNQRKLSESLKLIYREIKENNKLKNYLLIITTLGNTLSIMSFLIVYSKKQFSLDPAQIGNFLILKIIGTVITGLTLFYFSKKIKYSKLLYLIIILSVFLPLFVILTENNFHLFSFVFLLGGIIYGIYSVTINGILLEISTNNNRAIYAGAVGAGSLVPAIFPIFAGKLINYSGFNLFFIVYELIILSSIIFIKRLNCEK